MTITRPGQAELDGLLLGPGSPYAIKRLAGFGISPVRGVTFARPNRHGASHAGADYLPENPILGVVSLRDGTPAGDLGPVADALVAKFVPLEDGTLEFAYWRPGDDGPRVAFVRPRRLGLEVDYWWHHGIHDDVPFELVAADPRWYSTVSSSAVLSLPEAEGGRTYPRVYPLAYGGGTSGSVMVENVGTVTTYPTTVIAGPVTNPRVENVTTGQALEFGIAIAAGETLVVDHLNRTVMLNGTASRYGTLRRPVGWWGLVPGENEIRYGGDAYDPASTATVTFRSAWPG